MYWHLAHRDKVGKYTQILLTACGIIVVAVAIILWASIPNKADTTVEKDGEIFAVPPPSVRIPRSVSAAAVSPTVSPKKDVRQKVGEERNGYVLLPSGRLHRRRGVRVVEPGGANRSHPAAIFEHTTDNEFAVILALRPGETLIGGPVRHGGNYEKAFRESLKTPIVVDENDPKDVQSLKCAVIETRFRMKEALDRGEDIEGIVQDAYVEAQKLALYKDALRKQVNEVACSEDMTDADIDDLVTAANRVLESRGIAPMKFGVLTRARIRNLKK